ncbi:hypothetical protein SAMN06297129_0342 [Pseudooceanicola antarcticus]|uniref:Cytochrome C and Quinol oxidase polypeptide I n=1 Tax=Pseudooceanicola antarcticus TaxID=1247613 RepID=A0A285HSF8_9RHOB|nr:hypothetical protein [Pseudooceanicola antarcticus]PJE27701.1 hypothetical protein CVM39_14070 [Pseudooceanicola antarcticus]SNY37661.1 hypothetical protein SAMN06297129_0342 [Pseudooceanicola antarcticus]
MKGISYYFFVAAALCGLIGMGWGIQMSASGNHLLSPAHAHLNLIGWVSMAIFGTYYHLVPKAAEGLLPKIHLGLAVVGVVIIVPGIVQALNQTGETLAKLGSVLTILSMLIFVYTVIVKGRA